MNRTVGLPAVRTPLEKLFSAEFRTMSVIGGNLSPVLVGTSFASEARIDHVPVRPCSRPREAATKGGSLVRRRAQGPGRGSSPQPPTPVHAQASVHQTVATEGIKDKRAGAEEGARRGPSPSVRPGVGPQAAPVWQAPCGCAAWTAGVVGTVTCAHPVWPWMAPALLPPAWQGWQS